MWKFSSFSLKQGKDCQMIYLNVSKTLYESSTALGFKRSMHIEEGKEVYIIYISIYYLYNYILSIYLYIYILSIYLYIYINLYVLSTHVSQPPLMIVHYITYQLGNMFTFKLVKTSAIYNIEADPETT